MQPPALYIVPRTFDNAPMPIRRSTRRGPQDRYWERRIRSKAFKRDLAAAVAREINALSVRRVKDVINPRPVRALIQSWGKRLIDREVVAELIIQGNRRMNRRLRRQRGSLLSVLDPQLVDDIEALMRAAMELSPDLEDFVAHVMQQEFVRRLFSDVIFTAIVSFNQKVNPLFGAIAMRVMEEQIRGFIDLFMPALQRQAIAFAVNRSNQRVLFDFTRSIIRQLLNEPLRNYAGLASPGQQAELEALIREAVGNAQLESLIRATAVAAWDDFYAAVRDKPVGELLRLDEHARWLAERCVEMILPALRRPHILQFVAVEMALATPGRR